MRLSLTDVLLWPVERPHCARCRSLTNLTVITPSSASCEKRVFECPNCGLVEATVVREGITSAIFTVEIGDKPILTFEAKNLRESSELCREQWFRDDVARLKSHGVSLWDGKTALKTRYASEAEKVAFLEATGEAPSDDEIILVYLIELDVSTLKTP